MSSVPKHIDQAFMNRERTEGISFCLNDDGHLEVSRFKGDESIIGGKEIVDSILDEYKD
jgi:hypothetical protein